MKKFIALLLSAVIIVSAAALGSCSEQGEYPVTVSGITLEQEPENIVILSKNLADIISCIGYDVKMVGRSDEVTQKGLQVVPSVGSAQEPSLKKIIKLGAQLVFTETEPEETVKMALENNSIQVVVIKPCETQKQLKAVYKKIGTLLGGNTTGKNTGTAAYKDLIDTLKDVKSAVDSKDIVKTVAYFYIDNGVLKTFNGGTWGSEMIAFTDAMNVFQSSESASADSKTLLLSDVDYIFCADESVKAYLQEHSELSELRALNGNTFIIPYDEITMQGYTALDVVRNMLKDMYPEDFSD